MALGQSGADAYVDPATGYTLQTDDQGYRDASVALVEANRVHDEIAALIGWYEDFFAQANASGYEIPDQFFTDHADLLTVQMQADDHRATLQDYVNRYRIMVLGSGVSGLGTLGVLPLLAVAVAVGATAVAAALGYFLYRHYDIEGARTRLLQGVADYQRWIGEQAAAGTLDAATVQTLSGAAQQLAAGAASSGGGLADLLRGGTGLIVVAVVGYLALQTARR